MPPQLCHGGEGGEGNTRAGARTLKLRQEPVHSAVRGGVSLRQPVRGGRGGLGRGHRTTAGVSGVVGSGRSAPPPPASEDCRHMW